MGTTFKKFRGDEIQITPYDAHKEYLVYIEDYTGSYYEPYYEQSRILDHTLTSSAALEERVIDLNVYAYDAEHEYGEFFPDEYGAYQGLISSSGNPKTTNDFFKRAMHGSLQGMYYTNPDDPCYTLDNNGYEKEYRELNKTAQIISIPQRIHGDAINKNSVEIQSGSWTTADRVHLLDDGFGNLFDVHISGSDESGSVMPTSKSISYVTKSILTLNFSGLYNQEGETVTAHSINTDDIYQQKYGGSKFQITNDIRFFDRSPYPNKVEMYNAKVYRNSTDGAYIQFNGIEQSTFADRVDETKNSFIQIPHSHNVDIRRNEDYTVCMRISCSAEQPIESGGLYSYNHAFILHKQDYSSPGTGGYPFSLRQVTNNAPVSGIYGYPGHLQAQIKAGEGFVKLNSTGSVTGSGDKWWDVVIVKSNNSMSLYIDGVIQDSGSIPEGNVHSKGPITLGCARMWGGQYQNAIQTGTGNTIQKPVMETRANWKGSISNFSLYNIAFTPAEVMFNTKTNGRMTNHVGNVFYNHGIITLTSENPKYAAGTKLGQHVPMFSSCTLSLENSHQILEHEYSVHLKEREYMYTMNPTIVDDSKQGTLKSYVTSSHFSPYITTIGLYDEHARLLVVGKLSRPIKKSEEYDTSFIVRFDT